MAHISEEVDITRENISSAEMTHEQNGNNDVIQQTIESIHSDISGLESGKVDKLSNIDKIEEKTLSCSSQDVTEIHIDIGDGKRSSSRNSVNCISGEITSEIKSFSLNTEKPFISAIIDESQSKALSKNKCIIDSDVNLTAKLLVGSNSPEKTNCDKNNCSEHEQCLVTTTNVVPCFTNISSALSKSVVMNSVIKWQPKGLSNDENLANCSVTQQISNKEKAGASRIPLRKAKSEHSNVKEPLINKRFLSLVEMSSDYEKILDSVSNNKRNYYLEETLLPKTSALMFQLPSVSHFCRTYSSENEQTKTDNKRFCHRIKKKNDIMRTAGKCSENTKFRSGSASLPQTPKILTPLKRSVSHIGCFNQQSAILDNSSSILCRDTTSSRLRRERHQHIDDNDDVFADWEQHHYRTPLQRLETQVRQLKAQVKRLTGQIDKQETEKNAMLQTAHQEKTEASAKLQDQLIEMGQQLESANENTRSVEALYEDCLRIVERLQLDLLNARSELANRLCESDLMFLEMYKKGRQSAVFERETELELQQRPDRSRADATEREIREKLSRTEAELAKWQTLQRYDSYHTAFKPDTEAESTLRFLKDSIFHFLTSHNKIGHQHLRAMVNILHFTETQREKITHAIIFKRNKYGGW